MRDKISHSILMLTLLSNVFKDANLFVIFNLTFFLTGRPVQYWWNDLFKGGQSEAKKNHREVNCGITE
jgi:hypothetical protein